MVENEVLILNTNPDRAQFFLKEIANSTRSIITNSYQGKCKNLVLWGYGGKVQQQAIKEHRATGRNVIILDIGYFGRDYGYRRSHARLSINEWHPQNILKHATNDPSRFNQNRIKLLDTYDKDGHILLCGLGRKSKAFLGHNDMTWEKGMVAKINKFYPLTPVAFRPKPRGVETISGCIVAHEGDIKKWLTGCRLVVSNHSNVSVDACIHGVPAICTDGVGAAIYPGEISRELHLTRDERLDFLAKVAWFNWAPHESRDMMKFANATIEKMKDDK
jgi:hypothetical protein